MRDRESIAILAVMKGTAAYRFQRAARSFRSVAAAKGSPATSAGRKADGLRRSFAVVSKGREASKIRPGRASVRVGKRAGARASSVRVGKRAGIRASGTHLGKRAGARVGKRADGRAASIRVGKRASLRGSSLRVGKRASARVGKRASARAGKRVGIRARRRGGIRGIRAFVPARGTKRASVRYASVRSIRKLGIRSAGGKYLLVSPTGELAEAVRGRYTLDDGSILVV